jgi:chemotaxis response regulator CheB
LSKPITEPVAQAQPPITHYDFYLIGIGSSTGGLGPLKTIIAGLPADIPAAVIVVHHGPADAPDRVDGMLREVTRLPVIAVDKEEQIRPGHIYVAAPGQIVRLRDHVLTLESGPLDRKPSKIIDTCFRTLAYEGREKSICVILSGAGYDGVEGAKTVERHGGLVIVQDPATAKFPLMPVAIIANDDPSFILEPQEISDLISSQLGK